MRWVGVPPVLYLPPCPMHNPGCLTLLSPSSPAQAPPTGFSPAHNPPVLPTAWQHLCGLSCQLILSELQCPHRVTITALPVHSVPSSQDSPALILPLGPSLSLPDLQEPVCPSAVPPPSTAPCPCPTALGEQAFPLRVSAMGIRSPGYGWHEPTR